MQSSPVDQLAIPVGVDVLADLPGFYTVTRLYYHTHTAYEVLFSDRVEADDIADGNAYVPLGAMLATADRCVIVDPETGVEHVFAYSRYVVSDTASPDDISPTPPESQAETGPGPVAWWEKIKSATIAASGILAGIGGHHVLPW